MIMAGSSIFTVAWLKGMGERALASFAQGAILGLGLSTAAGGADAAVPDILALPWYAALSTGLAMAVLSALTSLLRPDFVAAAPAEPPTAIVEAEDDDVDESEADIEPQRAAIDTGEGDVDYIDGDDPDAYVDGDDPEQERAK
jgi:hypothetical protein